MKKTIFILLFVSSGTLLSAQFVKKTIEIKPISLHLYQQKIPFQKNPPISSQNVKGYVPVIKNHPYGDYTYNYLNPNNAQHPGLSLFIGFANYLLGNTVNKR